jgi:glycine C-acetyltransferase
LVFIRNSVKLKLAELKKKHLYRRRKIVEVYGSRAFVNGVEKLHLCSNDYLGLSSNQIVIKKALTSAHHISQCSSRLVAGNAPRLVELEEQIAKHKSKESSLVYPTGYIANLGVITALANQGTTIFSDEFNHASIVDACRLSGAAIKVFAHNDVDELEKLLRSSSGLKIVITEGVFSMDGDIPDLRNICVLARDYKATMIVDDAHGDFIFGSPGSYSGIPEQLKVNGLVDIQISSLSKALGCFGGYVATSREIADFLFNKSRQFIYTSALPEYLCAAASAAIPLAMRGNLQRKLFRNTDVFCRKLNDAGFSLNKCTTQIISLMIGNEKSAVDFSDELLLKGIFVQPIRYPTVKIGTARIRLTVTSLHNEQDLLRAADSLAAVGKKKNII